MSTPFIKHIWFDLNGTLTTETPEFKLALDNLCYRAYADAVKLPMTQSLKDEYWALYKQHGSKSAVFKALGMPKDYWTDRYASLDEVLYFNPDPAVYRTVEKLSALLPISLLSNSKPDRIQRTLDAVNIQLDWFTYILTCNEIKEPKPALEGFELIIEKSQLPAPEILFVGDREDVDIKPAKQSGLQTAYLWGHSENADYSFNKFEDLLSLAHQT